MRRFATGFLAIILTLVACSTVPYTERRRIILVSEAQEKQMGLTAYQEVCGKARLSSNSGYNDVVTRCGRRIAKVAGRDDFDWEFKVIDDPRTVNAFCLPGGKVAFYTGILPLCQDETGVAVVMGHEIAHAIARHGAERVSQSMVIEIGAAAVALALEGKSKETQGAVLALYGVGTAVALALPFSRKHESEADHIGLLIMAQAGYDPREAPRFWERMIKAGGKQPAEWMSTHPSHERRVEDLDDLMPEAIPYYEKATGQELDYHRHVIKSG